MSCNLDQIDDRTLDVRILRALRHDDGAAARSHLEAGRPIYYCPDDSNDAIVREWPDGRKDLVDVSDAGEILYLRCYCE